MTPAQLSDASFAGYPPEGRRFATAHLPLLRQLPLAVAPAFLGQVIVYDWRFPAERATLDRQCGWLESLSPAERERLFAPFHRIVLTDTFATMDWVNTPQAFIEAVTAFLWSSGQIDAYRRAAQDLLAVPADVQNTQQARRVVVVVGKDAKADDPQLFRKLAPRGVTLRNLRWTPDAPAQIHAFLDGDRDAAEGGRANSYGRWYLDGGEPWALEPARLQVLSYARLRPVRENILARMNRFTQSGPGGPEEMRSVLARLTPAESGAGAAASDPRIQHFVTSLFTEGSGTQIYSTSFVQWAARETLRRAQPQRLLVRFAPRQRQQTLNQMFDAAKNVEVEDPEGSLRDADIGAYYTWLDAAKLSDAQHLTFLAWREGWSHAVLIAPRAPAGLIDTTSLDIATAMAKYA